MNSALKGSNLKPSLNGEEEKVKAEKRSQTTTLLPNKLTLNKMNSAPKGSNLKPSLNETTRTRRIQVKPSQEHAGVQVAPVMVSIGIMCTLLTAPLESSSSDDDVVMPAAKDPEYMCPPESESDITDDSDKNASNYKDGEEGHSKMSPMSEDGDHSKERYYLVAESLLCGLMSHCQHCILVFCVDDTSQSITI